MTGKQEILAIIPARSGSKGLRDKNIRKIAGFPLIYWTISHALKSKYIDRVVFSSDAINYCEIAKSYGAETPFIRPQHLAVDNAIDLDVILHALNWLKTNESYTPSHVVRLQPTNPTFTSDLIDECIIKLIADPSLDSLRPIVTTPKHPHKMWLVGEEGETIKPFISSAKPRLREAHNQSRSELPRIYVQVGTCEVLKLATLLEQRSMAGNRVGYFEIDNPLNTPNIDTQLDFLAAEQALIQLGLACDR